MHIIDQFQKALDTDVASLADSLIQQGLRDLVPCPNLIILLAACFPMTEVLDQCEAHIKGALLTSLEFQISGHPTGRTQF